jgi:phosphoesterase RecJ-like protein
VTATEIKKVKTLLSKPKNIVIVTHWSPDGDAMGSSLGLYNYLIQKKHTVQVITPNDYPSFLNWLPGNKKVINFSTNPKPAVSKVAKADFIFCLDFNSLKRIDILGEEVAKSTAPKMIIDHHLEPEDFASYMLHNVKASSTCELIYDFIQLMSDKKKLTKDVANCLYTGIMTDTGSFRYPSTTAKTHRIVGELIQAGAENGDIHRLIYDNNTESRLKILGYCLGERLNVLDEYGVAYFSLSQQDLDQRNYQKGDTEGIVNFPLSIKAVQFSAFFVERDGIIKISFRSKGTFDVNKFARAHFSGGGHANAAGGMSKLSLKETVAQFVEVLPSYKKQLGIKNKQIK